MILSTKKDRLQDRAEGQEDRIFVSSFKSLFSVCKKQADRLLSLKLKIFQQVFHCFALKPVLKETS